MAVFNKVNILVQDIANKVHNFASDSIMVALTNAAPTSASAVLADITEIAYTNISSRTLTTTSSTQTAGLYKYIAADLVLTASGAVPAFRYLVLYNNTATSKNLVGFYDYGSSITLATGETLTLDLDQTNGVFTIQ